MTIGMATIKGAGPSARSLESLSAIVDSRRWQSVYGWLGLDDHGHPWVQIKPGSEKIMLRYFPEILKSPGPAVFKVLQREAIGLPNELSIVACKQGAPF